jgi:hypothetical protein
MKKILPLLVIGIFVLSGLGAVAIPDEKQNVNKPLTTQDWELDIKAKGGFLGYTISLSPSDPPPPNGTCTININTDAWITLLGKKLSLEEELIWNPGEVEELNMRPIIGLGPATVSMDVEYEISPGNSTVGEATTDGFVLLFYVFCEGTTIHLP